MAATEPTENQTGRTVRADKLKQVTQELDEARQVIALLGDAAGAGPDETWEAVAHRIRVAQDYVRILRGGVG
jgi:hypothetical protein